jgi:hypothetical protein
MSDNYVATIHLLPESEYVGGYIVLIRIFLPIFYFKSQAPWLDSTRKTACNAIHSEALQKTTGLDLEWTKKFEFVLPKG